MVPTGGIVLHLTAQAGTTTPEEEAGQKQEEEENRRLLMDGDDSKTRWVSGQTTDTSCSSSKQERHRVIISMCAPKLLSQTGFGLYLHLACVVPFTVPWRALAACSANGLGGTSEH